MNNSDNIIKMTKEDYELMRSDLEDAAQLLVTNEDIDSIDVRLCVDISTDGTPSWVIRTGDASFDQRHSEFCGASSLQDDSYRDRYTSVLKDLINQILDQASQ